MEACSGCAGRERNLDLSSEIRNIVVIQTAFVGDVILTLPLIQRAKTLYPSASIDLVVAPRALDVVANHPDVRQVISFDKRGSDRGMGGLLRLVRRLRSGCYDLALVPHRSLRSALLAWLSGIPIRVGFDRSAGRFLLTSIIPYKKDAHEIDRNMSLLRMDPGPKELPRVYPDASDQKRVDRLLVEFEIIRADKIVAIAPGTVWNTKRWPKERFAALAAKFGQEKIEVVLLGGPEDESLCREIARLGGSSLVHNAAGMLSILQSAELIRRCKVLVCNDSAPLHLAVAVGTPVVAIFGATVPSFGFGPAGPRDRIIETNGLSCRPCSAHGGDRCPIKTFDCMLEITHERVFRNALELASRNT